MPVRPFMRYIAAVSLTFTYTAFVPSYKATDSRSPLTLQRALPLLDTKGQIDHLAIDVSGQRLFVAEVANDTVDMVDLKVGKVVGRVADGPV